MGQMKKGRQIIILDDTKSLISMIMSHYLSDLTHFRGHGRNTEKISFGFWFKRRHHFVLRLSDL